MQQPGEPSRNPKGHNQYTYREDSEKEFAKQVAKRIAKTIERMFDRADADSTADAVAILARALPAVVKHELDIPGSDVGGLVDGLTAFFAKRRDGEGDGEPDEPGSGGSE